MASATPMLDLLRSEGIFDRHPLVLIDAGCRGGIYKVWRRFGQALLAHAFDPLVEECERLAAEESLPGVHYHAAYLGLPPDDPFVLRQSAGGPSLNPWSRLSTARAIIALAAAQRRDSAPVDPPRLAEPTRIGVANFAGTLGLPPVDFLKIDVDGADYEVLRSAEPLLNAQRILGVSIEINYWGSDSVTDNTFHNIDRYLRAHGFALFGLDLRPYSRSDLPAPFLKHFPAQTAFGAPLQGDALYFRDLAASYQHPLAESLPAGSLAKLAAMYEVFGLPDCAAEIINAFRHHFVEPDALLDALARAVTGEKVSYSDYLARFDADPTTFYPAGGATARADTAAKELPRKESGAAERISELERELSAARRDAQRLTRALERSEARAAELLDSRDRLKARARRSD